MSVAVRFAVRRSQDAELGSLAMTSSAFVLTAVVGLAATRELDLSEIWPFLIGGLLAPGLSQVFFVRAVREVGAARSSVLMGTAPLVAVAIALVFLHEPVRAPLLIGAGLIVGGGIALARERVRPADFRRVGVLLAVITTVLFAIRDNVLRSFTKDTHVHALRRPPRGDPDGSVRDPRQRPALLLQGHACSRACGGAGLIAGGDRRDLDLPRSDARLRLVAGLLAAGRSLPSRGGAVRRLVPRALRRLLPRGRRRREPAGRDRVALGGRVRAAAPEAKRADRALARARRRAGRGRRRAHRRVAIIQSWGGSPSSWRNAAPRRSTSTRRRSIRSSSGCSARSASTAAGRGPRAPISGTRTATATWTCSVASGCSTWGATTHASARP